MRKRSLSLASLLAIVVAPIVFVPAMQAQVRVSIEFKRQMFLTYEPMVATVSIENLTGQDLQLTDEPGHKWFGFEIETPAGRLIPPRDPNYEVSPVSVGPGQTLRRAINLTPLYPMSEFGTYSVRATVWVAQLQRFFGSNEERLEVTDGRPIWTQTIGVPPGAQVEGKSRIVSLLVFRLPRSVSLYIRIEDPDAGLIYCTHQLGRTMSTTTPAVELDAANQIHVLQPAAPKIYVYSKVGLNGEILVRKTFNETKTRPTLRKQKSGEVEVVGGEFVDPNAPAPTVAPPSVTDRPVPLPPGAKASPGAGGRFSMPTPPP